MSQIPIINKKYIFLQNIFYDSIQFKSFPRAASFALKKNQVVHSYVKHSNLSQPLKTSFQDVFLFKTKKQKYSFLLVKNPTNLNFFKKKEKQLQNLGIGITKISLFSEVSRKNQIGLFLPKSDSSAFTSNVKNLFKTDNFNKKINILNQNFPYKKSVICYWLLPFMGFVTCIPTVIDYASLSYKFVQFNQNFLNNIYLPVDIKKTNLFESATLNSTNMEKTNLTSATGLNKIRMDYKQKDISLFDSNGFQTQAVNLGFHNLSKFETVGLESNNQMESIKFDPLKKQYFKLYKLYSDDLEKTLQNSLDYNLGIALLDPLNTNISRKNLELLGFSNSLQLSYNQNNFFENIKSFKIYKIYLKNLIDQATLKSIWLNSFLKGPDYSKTSSFYSFRNKMNFLNKNFNILLSERLEKDTYSILDNINFNQPLINLKGLANSTQKFTKSNQNSNSILTSNQTLSLFKPKPNQVYGLVTSKPLNWLSFGQKFRTNLPKTHFHFEILGSKRLTTKFSTVKIDKNVKANLLKENFFDRDFNFYHKSNFNLNKYKGFDFNKGSRPMKLIGIKNKKLQKFSVTQTLKVAPKFERFSKILNNKVSKSQFFLELKEKNFLPSIVSNKEQFYKNPLLSYQLASSLMDRFDKINFSKKFYSALNFVSFKNQILSQPIGLESGFYKKAFVNDSNYENHYKFLTPISIFSNQQFNKHLNKNLFSQNWMIEDQIFDLTHNKEKKNDFLEKTIIFLLTKKIEKANIDNNNLNNENHFGLKKSLTKLNKESLYYLTLNALNNSLTSIFKDKNYDSENQLNNIIGLSKEIQKHNETKISMETKEKKSLVLNSELNKLINFSNRKITIFSKNNNYGFNLEKLSSFISKNKKFQNLEQNKQGILNNCKIKLSHPILMVNVKNYSFYETKADKIFLNRTTEKQNSISQQKSILNQTLNDASKNQILSNYQNHSANRIMTLKMGASKLNNFFKVEKQSFVKENNYSYFSKYLNLLSKKIQRIWLKPIQSSTLEKHFSFKNSKNKYILLKGNQIVSTKSPKLINSPTQTQIYNLGLTKLKLSKEKTSNFGQTAPINVKKMDYTNIPSKRCLVTYKKENFFLSNTPDLNKVKRFIKIPLKKSQPIELAMKKKSQILRLEKIFRSYLSKKFFYFPDSKNLDKNNASSLKTKKKVLSSLALRKTNITNNFSLKIFEKLKVKDINLLNLQNKKLHIKKHLETKKKFFNNRNSNLSTNFLMQKDFVSPSLLFKNRLVIKKTNTKKLTRKQKSFAKTPFIVVAKPNFQNSIFFNQESNEPVLNLNSQTKHLSLDLPGSNKYLSMLEKKKYNKKKRRKKKQRKETRRRKKRKRFYPRPLWLRFKFYNKFLKVRRTIILNDLRNSKNTFLINSKLKFKMLPKSNASTEGSHSRNLSFEKAYKFDLASNHLKNVLLREKICRNYSQNWEKTKDSQNQLSKETIQRLYGIPTGLICFDSTYLPFFTDKDFYYISRTVLGDLKRLFWKSNWLRANLNPYLMRVKSYLNDIKKVNNSWNLYLNIKKLNDEIFSLNHSFREVPITHSIVGGATLNPFYGNDHSTFLNGLKNINYQNNVLKNDNFFLNSGISSTIPRNSLTFNDSINIKNYLQSSYFSSDSMKWQVIINMAEYRRILYERIQQIILNIRENLNLSGQVKARSYKLGRKRLQAPKPVKDFWIKFGKTLTLEIPNHFPINFYGHFSKLRLYWAVNKSNLGSFKEFNQRNELWISQKLREQSKTNKTKKIIFKMNNSFNNFLDQKSMILDSHFKNVDNELLIKSLLNKGFFNKYLLNKTELNLINGVPSGLKEKVGLDATYSNSKVHSSLIKNWFESSNVTSLDKLKRSFNLTEQKLRKKEKKLSYLGFLTKKLDKLTLQKNYLLRSQQIPNKRNIVSNHSNKTLNSLNSNSFNKFTNNINYWYSYTMTPQINILPLFKNPGNYLKTNSSILWISAFFFHFCILLSVISFAEIRGLIKFHIILISKLFKIYLDIIFAIYQNFYNAMPNFISKNLGEFKTVTNGSRLSKNWFTSQSPNKNQITSWGVTSVNNININIKENNFLKTFLMPVLFPLWSKNHFELSQLKHKYIKKLIDQTDFFSNPSKIHLNFNSQTFAKQKLDEKRNYNLELNKLSLASQTNSFKVLKKLNILNPSMPIKKEFLDFIKENLMDKYSWSFYLNFHILGKDYYKMSNNLIASQLSLKSNKITFGLIYFSLIHSIIKSILILKLNSSKLIKTISPSFSNSNNEKMFLQTPPVGLSLQGITLKSYDSFKIFILSILTWIFSFSYKGSFYFYTSIIKSLDVFQFLLSSIYSFFEKPGELMVDWISYAFLVEWSSDLTTTIPDTIDSSITHSVIKTSRIVQPLFLSQYFFNFSILSLTPNLMQRRIWNSYQLFVEQFFQPDSDLIIRQKKGLIFWDLWSELLIDIAETSNINISELSSLKEEQNRLLDKLEIYAYEKENLLRIKNSGQNLASNDFDSKFLNIKDQILNLFSFPVKNSDSLGGWLKTQPGKLNLTKDKVSIKKSYLIQNFPNLTGKVGFVNNFTYKKQRDNNSLDNRFFLNNGLVNLAINRKKESKSQTDILWSVNQFLSYQGKDTELFIDLHPPKSFGQLPSIKYSQSIQQPLGTIICQIFSGIFSKQISKNILVIGSEGNEKSLLIQALAGETELKIITDNANRYAMIYRGVAIGIKLLRDVFEALSLHTPCIFLLEDIHYIGERRPFLISDDDTTKSSDFGTEKEEMHEKNQVIYQLSKHVVSHYKKPYKGDFSLLIPTNHFCFNLFLGLSSQKLRNSFITPTSPLNLNKIVTDSNQTYSSSSRKNDENISNDDISKLSSSLQIQKNQLLAPPATSPFSVLLLKEEKKLKPKQVVKEMPWSGLPGEQLALIAKSNYSTRVKIALLADMALSNVSVKLDIITDLLVIIDSVKGNRGFIVFATTHLPYILDPALRRPGRFDETIGLPIIPNLFSRWEILKANLLLGNQFLVNSFFPKGSTIDFSTISGIFNPNFPLGKFNDKFIHFNNEALHKELVLYKQTFNKKKHKSATITYHLSKKEDFIINPFKMKQYSQKAMLANPNPQNSKKIRYFSIEPPFTYKSNGKIERSKTLINVIARTYFYVSKIFMNLLLTQSLESQSHLSLEPRKKQMKQNVMSPIDLIPFENNIYLSLYASTKTLKRHFIHLIAGKLGELLSTSTLSFSDYKTRHSISMQEGFESTFSKNLLNLDGNKGLTSLYGIDKTWRSVSSLLFSIISKRYLLNRNLMTPKLLSSSNFSSFYESPSPPTSTILLPLKRYENYKRTFSIEQIKHKANFPFKNLQTTLQFHQNQRLVKRLYKLPIREFFRSEIISDKFVGFANSSITLAAVEKSTVKPTNINSYYRNRILNRHRNYLNTQWWNGQLNEHNTESTFSSEIDWRYNFVESIGDIFIDFPDAEQFYNGRNRRWNLTNGIWNHWFNFETITSQEIYNQFMFDCFIKAYTSLDKSREILDFYAFNSLNQSIIKEFKEISVIKTFSRFS